MIQSISRFAALAFVLALATGCGSKAGGHAAPAAGLGPKPAPVKPPMEGNVPVGSACVSDLDCLNGDVCATSGLCFTPTDVGSVADGDPCTYDTQCAGGEYCSAFDGFICVSDPYTAGYGQPGDFCLHDSDCASNYCAFSIDECA
jgi:hypothetical protein